MSHVSRFIVIFLYFCLNTANTQTGDSDPGLVPEGQLIYIDNPWNEKLNLPDTFCPFCGIWLNFTATWQPAPEFNAEYTIKFTFKHSNLEETKTNYVMKIPYDKIVTHKDINICFSPGPIMDKNIFFLYAETDNINIKNPVDIQVTVEMDYSGHCHTKTESPWVKVLIVTNCVTVLIIIIFIYIIKKCYIPRRRATGLLPGSGPEGGHPGGGGPGLGPPRDDSSDDESVGSDEEPSGGGLPRSGSDSSGPTGFLYYKNELEKRLRQIFGGGQIDAEQSKKAESVSLSDMSTSGEVPDKVIVKAPRPPRGRGRKATQENKKEQ